MEVGDRFARYVLTRRLAAGGMGELWAARMDGQDGFTKTVAIKLILEQYARDKHFLDMFIDEARLCAQLVHPNICQVFELGEHQGTHYLTMEYLRGLDLAHLWPFTYNAGRPISAPLICRIIADAAAGLDYAHTLADSNGQSYGLVHRDVSPQNIFVTFDGAVKIIDFGIAKARGRVTTTQAGFLKGKLAYMSPEQAQGIELDGRSDVFALGIVFHEMLTARPLFRADNELATIERVRNLDIPPPSSMNPSLPETLDRIVLKALARDRDLRYKTAHDLRLDIEEWLTTSQLSASAAHLVSFLREIVSAHEELKQLETPAKDLPSVAAEPATGDVSARSVAALAAPSADDRGTRPVQRFPSAAPKPAPARSTPIVILLAAVGLIATLVFALTQRAAPTPALTFAAEEAPPADCPAAAVTQAIDARTAIERQNYGVAEGAVASVTARCPKWALAHHLTGKIAQKEDRLDEAEAAYKEAVRLRPEWNDPAFNLALVLLAKKRVAEAIPLLERVVERAPNDAAAKKVLEAAKRATSSTP
ncbi:MAG: protein kinase [Deltaproteobacteria bacterium]|nr:protein kinase [Deltaproteobacteria bacterium]